MNKYLELGQIVNVKGLKGEVKVNSFTDDNTKFERIPKVFIKQKSNLTEYEIEKVGYNKNQVIIKFKNIDTVEEAEKLRNSYIVVDREIFGELPEGVYYIADLIGLEVYTEANEYLGKVDDIFSTGSNDVYVVKDELGKQKLLPGIDEVIKKIDLESSKIIVNLIEGLNMKFDVLTLFPEMFEPIKQSVIGRAEKQGLIEINLINIRDFSKDKHKKVDDTVYGGGAGMLIKPDVVYDAYKSVKSEKSKVIYLTPQGKTLCQNEVEKLAKTEEHLILLCGHYEGIDQRVLDKIVDEEISIGDYVLTGGEIPAMVLIDSVSRYIDGVLTQNSTEEESFSNGLLEYPQYTRPEEFEGIKVPEVLQSGHHENIDKWRRKEAIKTTYIKRPELLEKVNLTDEERKYINELKNSKD